MNTAHRALIKLSGGRRGWHTSTMPVVELTTTGRKTGRLHSVLLTCPIRDGPNLVVVASGGGNDKHPAWFLNLRDDPHVEVALPEQARRPMRARIATSEERSRLWPRIVADHRNYGVYQSKTTREIPVVLLEAVLDGDLSGPAGKEPDG